MATLDDVEQLALELPEVTETLRRGHRSRFSGFAAVLVRLNKVGRRELREVVLDGWLACAPQSLAEAYLKRT